MNLKRLNKGDIVSFPNGLSVVEFIEWNVGGDDLTHFVTYNNDVIYRYAQYVKVDEEGTIWAGTPKDNHWIPWSGYLLCQGKL